MVCKQEKNPAELITPQEITAIMQRAGTIDDIVRAQAVALEYIKQNNISPVSFSWDMLCVFSNIYQAGRLQGIREQKAKYASKQNGGTRNAC